MNEEDSDFLFRPFETFNMGGQKVDEQDQAEKPTARQNRNLQARSGRRPIDEEAAKELGLDGVETQIDLGNRAGEDQDDSQAKTDDRQAQRGNGVEDAVKHAAIGREPFGRIG